MKSFIYTLCAYVLLSSCAQACQINEAELRWHDGSAKIRLRLADTPQKHAEGLMGVRHLPQDEGMLFIFPEARPRVFWMKDTFIPLDIAYFDESGRLVSRVTGEAEDETYLPSEAPARYVLEVNAGWFEQMRVTGEVEMRALYMEQKHLRWSCTTP